MDNERIATRGDDLPGQGAKRRLRVLIVDTGAALDRHGNFYPRFHRGDAIADTFWLPHQASAKGTACYAPGRTTGIEIDFVIAKTGANLRRLRQFARIGTAKLQDDGMLRQVERK